MPAQTTNHQSFLIQEQDSLFFLFCPTGSEDTQLNKDVAAQDCFRKSKTQSLEKKSLIFFSKHISTTCSLC